MAAPAAAQPTIADQRALWNRPIAPFRIIGNVYYVGTSYIGAYLITDPAGHVLIGMRYDERGVNVRRAVIERQVPAALADTLQKLVFAYRRALPQAEREWGVRLRMDLGEQPVMRVGRSLVCAPRARDPAAGFGNSVADASFGDVRQSAPSPGLAESSGAVWVRVVLDAGGNVTDARVERTAIRAAAEQQVLRYVRNISFIPATEDGYPVPGQLTFALRLGR